MSGALFCVYVFKYFALVVKCVMNDVGISTLNVKIVELSKCHESVECDDTIEFRLCFRTLQSAIKNISHFVNAQTIDVYEKVELLTVTDKCVTLNVAIRRNDERLVGNRKRHFSEISRIFTVFIIYQTVDS